MSFPFLYMWIKALTIVLTFPAGGLWHGGLLPCHPMAGGGRQALPRIIRTVEYRGWGKSGGRLGSLGLCLFPGRGVSGTHCFHHTNGMLYICFTMFWACSCFLIYFIFPTGPNVSQAGQLFYCFHISHASKLNLPPKKNSSLVTKFPGLGWEPRSVGLLPQCSVQYMDCFKILISHAGGCLAPVAATAASTIV